MIFSPKHCALLTFAVKENKIAENDIISLPIISIYTIKYQASREQLIFYEKVAENKIYFLGGYSIW